MFYCIGTSSGHALGGFRNSTRVQQCEFSTPHFFLYFFKLIAHPFHGNLPDNFHFRGQERLQGNKHFFLRDRHRILLSLYETLFLFKAILYITAYLLNQGGIVE